MYRLDLDHGYLGDPVNFVYGQFGLSPESCGLNEGENKAKNIVFLSWSKVRSVNFCFFSHVHTHAEKLRLKSNHN